LRSITQEEANKYRDITSGQFSNFVLLATELDGIETSVIASLDGKEGDEYHSGDGENFRTPGYKISEARAITMDYQGNILITENDAGFVRKISLKIDSIEEDNEKQKFLTCSVYPNPFNGSLTLYYRLIQAEHVVVSIYDILGKRIRLLENGSKTRGEHQVHWDGRDWTGQMVASGIYIYRLDIENYHKSGKVFYLK